MVVERRCINLYSDMNPWMDFVVLVNEEDFGKAKKILQDSMNSWFEDEDAECEPIGEWISNKLKENKIEFEMYFKSEDEEVEI